MIAIDEIIRTKRKSIALIVQRDGSLTVRAPLRASEKDINRIVEKKAEWIKAKQKLVKSVYPVAKPKEFVNGEGFWYLGKIHRLSIVDDEILLLNLNGNFYISRTNLPTAEAIFTKWYRKQAEQIISERVQWYAAKHGFDYSQVKITSARTRWGSCNSKGILCFTWRLVMAPVPVIDYVAVHELLHTQVKNHSRVYWSKLRLILPDYKQRIEWLEINGHLLNLD